MFFNKKYKERIKYLEDRHDTDSMEIRDLQDNSFYTHEFKILKNNISELKLQKNDLESTLKAALLSRDRWKSLYEEELSRRKE